jgi:hypothetical protein
VCSYFSEFATKSIIDGIRLQSDPSSRSMSVSIEDGSNAANEEEKSTVSLTHLARALVEQDAEVQYTVVQHT